MKNILIGLLTLFTTSSISAAISAAEVSHVTKFHLYSLVGENTERFPSDKSNSVTMPDGLDWQCQSIPVSFTSNGVILQGGFQCKNAHSNVIQIAARCFSHKIDAETKDLILVNTNNSAQITLVVSCVTEEVIPEGSGQRTQS